MISSKIHPALEPFNRIRSKDFTFTSYVVPEKLNSDAVSSCWHHSTPPSQNDVGFEEEFALKVPGRSTNAVLSLTAYYRKCKVNT